MEYHAVLVTKFGAAPTAGLTVDLWIGYSDSKTAGTNNWGNCTGADAAYTGYSGGTAAQSVLQLDRIGSLKLDANAGPQEGIVGSFVPRPLRICRLVQRQRADHDQRGRRSPDPAFARDPES